jgi:hypothetical protein
MLQVAAFLLPGEQEKANAFLATHRPAGPLNFNQDRLFVFYDDGTHPVEYEISELEELLSNVRAARRQQEIALNTMEYERANLNMVHNKGQYEEMSNHIMQTKKSMDLQGSKEAYLLKKIEELRTPSK